MIRIITIVCSLLFVTLNVQAQSACTRPVLQTAVDSYLAAQGAGDISKMALAADAKFFENMAEVARDKGLWNTALPIAFSRSILDPSRCRTFTEVIVTEGGHPYVLGTRLNVADGKITEINGLVTDKGDWLFNANAYLKYSKAEEWSTPAPAERTPAQILIDAANRYLDVFADKQIDLPWGMPCARLEGGAYTNRDNKPDASCNIGIPPGVLYIVNRSFVVDEEQGVVNVFCRFGNSSTGMPDSHTFRLVNGKFHHIHTLSVNLNPDTPSPQAADDGSMIRPPAQQ
ncbi:MAG: hypothetical protein HW411_1634 [Gammaproteobacteria bacterium]|nr:hypothetical protein [Gammaproteobacteria bacterium]MBM2830844.1 hypothetical protein [Gammaproteobacteria bacterium]